MISVVLNALILMGLMWLVARNEADMEMYKAVFAALVISTLSWGFPMMTLHVLGVFSFLLAPLATVFILKGLCWLPYPKAVLVTVLYFTVWAGIGLVTGSLLDGAYEEQGMEGPSPRREAPAAPAPRPQEPDSDGGSSGGLFAGLVDTVTGWFGDGGESGTGLAALFSSKGAGYAGIDAPQWDEAGKSIRISGTGSSGEGRMTLFVNGAVVSDGEVLEVPLGGKIYQWQLQINPDQTYTWIPVYEAGAQAE